MNIPDYRTITSLIMYISSFILLVVILATETDADTSNKVFALVTLIVTAVLTGGGVAKTEEETPSEGDIE